MLYLVGIGLNDEKDISIKGLEVVKSCDKVYLETYTSRLNCSIGDLEGLYGKKIKIADRDFVENKDLIIEEAKDENVALLIIGCVFGATTHIDLILRAKKENVKVEVIDNLSILTAVGITGLQLYKFGVTTSIPFDNKNVRTPYEVFKKNYGNGLHTLFLLDLKGDKLMAVREALDYLIRLGLSEDQLVVGCGALGTKEYEIKVGKAKDVNINKSPQCLIIPGKLHFMEEEMLDSYK